MAYFLTWERAEGKSRAALLLAKRRNVRRILCVAPPVVIVLGVWEEQARKWWPELNVVAMAGGSRARRAARLRVMAKAGDLVPTMVLVNYEAYWGEPLRAAILAFKPDAVIYDEAHRLKGRGTKQARFAHTLHDRVPQRLALTGTPSPNGPHELFSLFKAIDTKVFGTRYADFEHRYVKKGGYFGHEIVGYRNMEELTARVAEASYRITKAEALDLPEQMDVQQVLPMPASAREVYDQLAQHAIAEVEGAAGGAAVARTVLVNILRLQQVTSGFVKLVDGREVMLHREKLRALRELVADVGARVVVFCRFRLDIQNVAATLAEDGLPVWTIYGREPKSRWADNVAQFNAHDRGVLVMQIQTGLGIELTSAHTAVYYSLDYSLVNHQQTRDRLHRQGQRHAVTYYYLLAEDSIDQGVLDVLGRKEDLARTVLDRRRAISMFSGKSL